jgi:hypothetical protein
VESKKDENMPFEWPWEAVSLVDPLTLVAIVDLGVVLQTLMTNYHQRLWGVVVVPDQSASSRILR